MWHFCRTGTVKEGSVITVANGSGFQERQERERDTKDDFALIPVPAGGAMQICLSGCVHKAVVSEKAPGS